MGTYTNIDTTGLSTNGWVQTFFDGFDGAYLDRAAWPIVQYGYGANGAFTYSPSNIFGYNGEMDVANIADGNGWTSGAFQQGWNGQMYGRWSINARFDAGQGVTAAILLWPESGDSRYEIDIVEPRTADKTTLNNTTIHGPNDAITVPFDYDATQWHTYTVDFKPGLIDIYLDGTKILETNQRVPDEPMSLGFLGYVANGGDSWFGGQPNAQTPAVSALHIDWVREWTLADQYAGNLPAALYGTSTADLHLTSDTYTGQWTAGLLTDANGNREYALTGQRSIDGTTNYAATWNAAAWNDQVTLVTDAPATWDASNGHNLLFGNFVDVELDFRAAASIGLNVVAEGAQHGNIVLGDGNNSVTWVEHSSVNAGTNNVMTIVSGAGNDNIHLTAAAFSTYDEPFAWGSDWNKDYDGHASIAQVSTGAGNDTITIDAGQAIIDAGAGDDTVAWNNPMSRFTIDVAPDGATRVVDTQGVLGTSLLYGVEHLAFSDQTIAAPSSTERATPITVAPIGTTPSTGLPPPVDPAAGAGPGSGPGTGTGTGPGPGTSAAVTLSFGTGPDSVVLHLSQDAYDGNAQYTVSVDGTQVGGTFTAGALHGSGQEDVLTLNGSWGSGGGHVVAVNFLNDSYGGTAATDRNLYVDSISYDGTAMSPGSAALMSTGATSFAYGTATVAPPASVAATDWNAVGSAMNDYHAATGQWWGADYTALLSWDAAHNAQLAAGTAPPPVTTPTTDWNAVAAQAEANYAATGHWYL